MIYTPFDVTKDKRHALSFLIFISEKDTEISLRLH